MVKPKPGSRFLPGVAGAFAGLAVFVVLLMLTAFSVPMLYLRFGPRLILGTALLFFLGGLASAAPGILVAYLLSRRVWPALVVATVSLAWLGFLAVLVYIG